MSIKAFHVLFIVISTLFALGLGGWSVREYRRVDGLQNMVMAILAFAAAVALVVYGRWFLRKLKGLDS
jgi:hypothetical protein